MTSWLVGNGVYALNGDHIGWFEISTLYDLHNQIIGMLQHACTPPLAERAPPPMPEFPRRPHIPLLKARHQRIRAAMPPPAAMYASVAMQLN